MTVEIMKRGEKLNIQKTAPGMKKAHFGLNWDVRKIPGPDYDLDFFMIMLNKDGKVAYGDNNTSLIFYNHKENPNKSIYVLQDNLTGADTGSGPGYYDEEGFIVFDQVPAEVMQIVACVSIYQYDVRNQNFGQVNNARCDILNGDMAATDPAAVLATYDLTEDMSNATGITVGRFRREADNTWSFKAVGESVPNGMKGLIAPYGMSV